ncbi:MAG: Bpu10I family restriction endonuclease [Candidatus Cloacimonetes bacterium]|nr:Bpu10I family restriction endonuclease [Candidatus Cloacimonadota bacterium]MBL7085679.1 Bpu10I family restriction endonuclease [Candidatus Cloacimonadota bacterium]
MLETFRHGETISEMLEQVEDARKKMYLNEINLQYKKWKKANLEISENNENTIKQKIKLYMDYRYFLFSKKFRDENTFIKNRKLFETALSEFIYYIIKDLDIITRGSETCKKDESYSFERAELPFNFKFEYEKLNNIKNEKILSISTQKMRLVICNKLYIKYRLQNRKTFFSEEITIPFVIIETAMVLDDWIILNFHNQVRRFKMLFPKCIAILVCEVVNSDFKIDVTNLSIDGIYILQQQTTKMKRKEISYEVLLAFINKIQKGLFQEKEDILLKVQKGILIG